MPTDHRPKVMIMTVNSEYIDSLISDDSLTRLLPALVDIASPTGEEGVIAKHIVCQLREWSIEAQEQVLDSTQSNAFGTLQGKSASKSAGKSLLLYAPVDTVTSNNAEEDLPWVGTLLRNDMQAKANIVNGHVIGLGAHNPKGHAACILEAARILKILQTEFSGNVYFGFGAGGMPTEARANMRPDSGHGVGCEKMIQDIVTPDAAIIAKSGWAVSSEEVGFIWVDVNVAGTHTYVGSRHLLPYSNAIANASKLILKLEDWFAERAEKHGTDLIKPQGVISFIESGWERMPAFTPATCRFRLDLRFGPDMTATQIEAEFKQVLERFADELDIDASYQCVRTIDASRTPVDDEVIQTAIACWQEVTGKTHEPFKYMSGSTDANILRKLGIPTARIGLPKAQLPNIDFALGMNSVAISDLRQMTAFLVLSTLKFLGGRANV